MDWKQLQNSVLLGTCIENKRQNNFTFIRLAACLLVVLTHSYGIIEEDTDPVYRFTAGAFTGSYLGLSAFFFLSGLLVSQSLYSSPSLVNFLWRRVIRVYPAAIFSILFCAFIVGPLLTTYPLKDYFSSPVFYRYLATCFLIKVYYPLPGVFEHSLISHSVNASLWSISLELKLYACLFLSRLVKIPNTRHLVLLPIIISLVCGYFFYRESGQILTDITGHPITLYVYTTYATYFLIGVLCYSFKDKIRIAIYWIPILIMLFIAIVYFHISYLSYFIFIPALIIYVSANGTRWLKKITPPIDLSYGIYVFAFPVEQIVVNYLHPAKSVWLFVLTVLCVLPFALFSWYVVERNALSLKNRIK